MRFVHVADVHLDTSFAGRSEEVRRRLREASREAFRRAVDLAIREDVHALLIAGDLFDGERLSFRTERFLLDESARLRDHGITVVYATGNHDPGSPAGGPRPLDWPSNVRIAADDTPQRYLVSDAGGRPVGYVTTAGHASASESRDLSRLLPRPTGELPEVGLLHTQVHASVGADEHHPYAPSELSYLQRAGYDYWALGHVHVRQMLSEDPPIWYAGSLQGRTHADRGERGALLVDLSDREAPVVTFRPLARVRWETFEVDRLEGVASLDDLERQVQLAWERGRKEDPGASGTEWMLRVVLSGPCPLWSELRTEEDREVLARELRDLLGALEVTALADGVHPVLSLDEHRVRVDVLGEALRLAEAVRRGEARLGGIGPSDLVGLGSDDTAAVERYVRDLLDGVDAELAARLLQEPGA
ncbi:MAG TPA: DNA repair exonuclease [Longimicrobiales bacterium]|nr:DNA repair exonuclease [Longimicrobiales bacterium]